MEHEVPEAATACADCERLRALLREAQDERDRALLALANEREKSNAILMSQVAPAPVPPPPQPIRYWAVDVLNDGIKKVLPWPHAGVRAVAGVLRKLRRETP